MKRVPIRALWAWLTVCLCLSAPPAEAHKPSDSYLTLTVNPNANVKDGAITGQWDIALRDLDFALGLDANGDGDITWGEVRARHADMAAFAQSRLNVTAVDGATPDGSLCTLQIGPQAIDGHTDASGSDTPADADAMGEGLPVKPRSRLAL